MLKPEEIPQLKWTPADEEGIIKFLVADRNFNESRVRQVVKKINADRGKSNQGRILAHVCKPPELICIHS